MCNINKEQKVKNMKNFIIHTCIILFCLSSGTLQAKSSSNSVYIEPVLFKGSVAVKEISNNTNANFVTNVSYGFNLEWNQYWKSNSKKGSKKSNFSTKIFANYLKHSFGQQLTRTVEANSFNSLTYGLGFKYLFTRSLYINMDAYYGKELYLRSSSVETITFDQTNAYGTTLLLGWDFFKSRPYIIGFNFGYTSIFADKINNIYKADYAYSTFGQVYFSYKNIITEFVYEKKYKNTDVFEQTYTYIFLKVGYKWLF